MTQRQRGRARRTHRSAATSRVRIRGLAVAVGVAASLGAGCRYEAPRAPAVQLGPRPGYLIDRLAPGPLRSRLEVCASGPFRPARFSIGHRGAPLQFPEHTRESYRAAARMGAGVIECDVTFTADRELVCRHAQCDLATTTNILETPLAERCREPFRAARFGAGGALERPAGARCCASDLTLAEFRSLEGRMEAGDPRATRAFDYARATPDWRTELYTNGGTLMTHAESVALFRSLGVGMAPELKAFEVEPDAASGFDRPALARRLVDVYRKAGIPPEDVRLQSFDLDDLRLWLEIAPEYGRRAIWLDGRDPLAPAPSEAGFAALHAEGVRTIAPPISALLRLDAEGRLRASDYALRARAAGLELIGWTIERSGRLRSGRVEGRERDFYLGPIQRALDDDGDLLRVIDALVNEVGVSALFSDWPATTTYYANCMGLD